MRVRLTREVISAFTGSSGLFRLNPKVPGDVQLARGRWWFRTTDLRLVRAIRRSSLTCAGAAIIHADLLF
jgi:hypothetical protein